MTPTHTLTHIDGIAMGSLLALGLYTLPLSRRVWLWIGLAAMPIGFLAAATIAGGTAFLDSALTTLFAGAVLVRHRLYRRAQPRQCDPQPRPAGLLRPHQLRPLHDAHHGLHLLRLVRRPHGHYGIAGNLAVVAFRLAACTLAATVLWYGFESRILRLKRHFEILLHESRRSPHRARDNGLRILEFLKSPTL